MKISEFFRNEGISGYKSNATKSQKAYEESQTTRTLSGDTLELSEGAQQYTQINKAVRSSMENAEIDEASRVDSISKEIGSGTYQPDMSDVVRRIMTATA